MNQKRIDQKEKLNSKVQEAVDKYQNTIQNLLDEEEMEYTVEDVTQDIVI